MSHKEQLSKSNIEKVEQLRADLGIEFPQSDFRRIIELLIEHSGLSPDDLLACLSVDTCFYESYGSDGFPFNSIDYVDFLCNIEEVFDIDIDVVSRSSMDALREIVKAIIKKRKEKQ